MTDEREEFDESQISYVDSKGQLGVYGDGDCLSYYDDDDEMTLTEDQIRNNLSKYEFVELP